MHRTGFALLLALVSLSAGAAERRYLQLSTPELTLVSAASEQETRRIALRVGVFRSAVELALGISIPSTIHTRIYALSGSDWKRYAQPRAGLSGCFLAHPASSDLIFDVDDASAGAYELIFHEYVHHILRTAWAGEIPPFVDEGLAEIFSTASFDEGALLLEPRLDYVRFLRHHNWSPFERLINLKRNDPEYLEHSLAPAFYAQAWATMYFAMSNSRSSNTRVRSYLRELRDGLNGLAAAERFLGSSGIEANRKISAFIRRREGFPVARIAIGGTATGDLSTLRQLDHRDSTLAVAELMLRFGNQHDKAENLFDEVLRQEPDNLRARVGSAWSHLQAGNWEQAAILLDAAADTDNMDTATAVRLGRGLYQLVAATSKTDSPDTQQRERLLRSRALLDTAMVDRHSRIEAISGYVLSSLALGESDPSLIVLAEVAYRAAPRSPDLAIALAILHEVGGQKDAARAYWRAAIRTTQTGPLRERIMNLLDTARENPEQSAPSD